MIQYHSEDMSMFHHSPGNPFLAMARIEQKWGLCNALKPNLSRMKTRPHRFSLSDLEERCQIIGKMLGSLIKARL
jgi:hypothetical protein